VDWSVPSHDITTKSGDFGVHCKRAGAVGFKKPLMEFFYYLTILTFIILKYATSVCILVSRPLLCRDLQLALFVALSVGRSPFQRGLKRMLFCRV
jgi:hypothetical protein